MRPGEDPIAKRIAVNEASGLALLASALLATWLPARRAVRIDPLVALREE